MQYGGYGGTRALSEEVKLVGGDNGTAVRTPVVCSCAGHCPASSFGFQQYFFYCPLSYHFISPSLS